MKTQQALFAVLAALSLGIGNEAALGAPVTGAGTNGMVAGPPAANPFLKLRPGPQGQVVQDYQYQSDTNTVAAAVVPGIQIEADEAVARSGAHTVHFKANLKDEDAITVDMPDGRVLQGRVAALSVSDGMGHRVWLGEVKDCAGEVLGDRPNQALYADAFDGIRADVLFSYDDNSIEQDVIFREAPVLPPEMDEETARLEIWSEFAQAPEPRKQVTSVRMRDAGLWSRAGRPVMDDDEALDFGGMRMVPGKAFRLGDGRERDAKESVPVVKRWQRSGTRAFLLESADYLSLKTALENLGAKQARAGTLTTTGDLAYLSRSGNEGGTQAVKRSKAWVTGRTLLASVAMREPGVVVDWRLVNSFLLNINFGEAVRIGPAAAGKTSSDFWNLFAPRSGPGTKNNLTWSDGTASGIQLVVENAPGVWGNSTGDTMMDTYVYPQNGGNVTVRLNNIYPGTYDLYIYGAWGGVGSVNGKYNLSVAGQAKGLKQTVLGANWAALNWAEGEHYVLYSNVQVGSGQEVTLVAMPGGNVALFNGLQMVVSGSQNMPPALSDIPDQETGMNTPTVPIDFIINDAETPVESLTITAVSSSPALVPNGNIAIVGSGNSRSMTVMPAQDQVGTTTITITVSDGVAQASDTFTLTVADAYTYLEVSKSGIVADASTTGFGWLPQYAINGLTTDPGWHNAEGRTPGTDWLRLNLGSSQNVGRVQYYPRAYAGNGTFLGYQVYVTDSASTDMATWGAPVASGTWTWPNGAELKTLTFTPKSGRYVVFRCVNGAYYDRYASANEPL